MRLWLDDRRKPPWGYDLWAQTADEAIRLLREHNEIEHCSLDHDLADEHYDAPTGAPGYGEGPRRLDRSKFKEKTGYAVLEWMLSEGRWVKDISVHTLSEVGGFDMMLFLERHAPEGVQFRRVKPYTV